MSRFLDKIRRIKKEQESAAASGPGAPPSAPPDAESQSLYPENEPRLLAASEQESAPAPKREPEPERDSLFPDYVPKKPVERVEDSEPAAGELADPFADDPAGMPPSLEDLFERLDRRASAASQQVEEPRKETSRKEPEKLFPESQLSSTLSQENAPVAEQEPEPQSDPLFPDFDLKTLPPAEPEPEPWHEETVAKEAEEQRAPAPAVEAVAEDLPSDKDSLKDFSLFAEVEEEESETVPASAVRAEIPERPIPGGVSREDSARERGIAKDEPLLDAPEAPPVLMSSAVTAEATGPTLVEGGKPLYPAELETRTYPGAGTLEDFNAVAEPETLPEAFAEEDPREERAHEERGRERLAPIVMINPEFVSKVRRVALKPDKRIISYHSPTDHVCEEYRLLGKNILHTFGDGPTSKRGRAITLTSAVRGEGKTLTSVNLSLTLSQDLPDRVLLIDSDLRHPKVHKYLGVPPFSGLNDLLDSPDPGSIVERCLQRTESGLHLLTCAGIGRSPAALLDSRQMSQIIDLLRDRYSLIIIDTPPVLLATDALTMGTKSDGMLFLMRARKTQREQIQEARQRIARLDIRLLGYVINNVKTFLPRIWSRYYYGNY